MLISSPESLRKFRLLFISIIINAPVFDLLILKHAFTIELTSVKFLIFSFLKKFILSNTEPFLEIFAEPTINKNFLISG